MAKYLQLTVNIPIRDKYEDNKELLAAMDIETISIGSILADSIAVIEMDEEVYAHINDDPFVRTLAHVVRAEVKELAPGESL